MKRSYGTYSTLAVALALALGGCSTWQHTSRQEKGTAVGATGGAIVGAAVGGPVGAAVGAGVGGYAGHYETQPGGLAAANGPLTRSGEHGNGVRYSRNSAEIRSVQQALTDKGYNAGAVDGIMGPHTKQALRSFQQAQHLRPTGWPDSRTLAALGVSNQATNQASNQDSKASNQASSPSTQAANEPNQANESNHAANESNGANESNQASNPGSNQASDLPGQASNQAGSESRPPAESNTPNQANESNAAGSNSSQGSNQQR